MEEVCGRDARGDPVDYGVAHPLARLGSTLFDAARERLRLDTFMNVITGLGTSRDRLQRARVYDFIRLTPAELDAMYHGDDLPARIVDKIVDDGLRQGWKTGDDTLDRLLARGPRGRLSEAARWGRLYGVGAILLGVDERLGPVDAPLDRAQIGPGDLRYLLVLDRQDLSIVDRDRDPRSTTYGEPSFYRVGGTGSVERHQGAPVHASRLIVFGGARTSERQRLKNEGFDLSVLQRPFEILRDADQSWRTMMLLAQDMSQAVYRMKGLANMIAEGDKDVVMSRMEVVDMARSATRMMVVDADTEDFSFTGGANVGAIDPILTRIFQRVATAADMPVTTLLGISPAGMNATGESDTRSWYDRVRAWQEDITEQALALSRVVARANGIEPPTAIEWPSLWQMTPTEEADLDAKKAATDKVRIDSGVLSPEQAALILYGGRRPADVIDLATLEARAKGDPEPAEGDPLAGGPVEVADEAIDADTDWIDTEDGHRLRVTVATPLVVRFLDLDGANPARQWSWSRRSFLERARPEAAVPAPAPEEPPVAGVSGP